MFRRLGTALSRRSHSADAMREATAQTTVMLLEQNRKFELWLRQKIEALEARVSAQEARLSREADTEDERWLTPEFSDAEEENPDWAMSAEDPIDEAVSGDDGPIPDYLAMMTQPASPLAYTQPLHPHHLQPETSEPYEPHELQEPYEPYQLNGLSPLTPPPSLTELTPLEKEEEDWD